MSCLLLRRRQVPRLIATTMQALQQGRGFHGCPTIGARRFPREKARSCKIVYSCTNHICFLFSSVLPSHFPHMFFAFCFLCAVLAFSDHRLCFVFVLYILTWDRMKNSNSLKQRVSKICFSFCQCFDRCCNRERYYLSGNFSIRGSCLIFGDNVQMDKCNMVTIL